MSYRERKRREKVKSYIKKAKMEYKARMEYRKAKMESRKAEIRLTRANMEYEKAKRRLRQAQIVWRYKNDPVLKVAEDECIEILKSRMSIH